MTHKLNFSTKALIVVLADEQAIVARLWPSTYELFWQAPPVIVTAARSHREYIPKPSVEAFDGQPSDIGVLSLKRFIRSGDLCDQGI